MKTVIRALSWAGAMLVAVAMLATGSAGAEPMKLKFAIFSPDREQTYLTVFKPFAEAVNQEAAGVIEIELFPNGALGRNPQQQAQMVLDGVADLAWIVASYTPGRFQENEVFELPSLFADLREGTLVLNRLVEAGKISGYEDFVPIGLFTTAPYSLHTRLPLGSLSELDGKKIRTSGAIESEVLKAFGAAPIGMPVTEVPEAIGRGTIDGTTSHPSPLFDFGIERVTNAHYFTRLGVVPIAVLMNREKFESLPQAGQDAILKYSGLWTAERFIDSITAYNDSLVEKLKADPNRTVSFPPQSDFEAIQPTFDRIIETWAAASPRNQELLDIVRAEIAAIRAGQ